MENKEMEDKEMEDNVSIKRKIINEEFDTSEQSNKRGNNFS